MNSSVRTLSAAFKKSIRVRSRGPYRRSRCPGKRLRISAERCSQPATISTLPGTATPLLSPRSRASWLMARQSSSENNVVMQISPVGPQLPCVPLCRKMFYSTIRDQETKTNGDGEVADQGLVRETACAIVGKLKSGEVTPLDLLDALEERLAEVDVKVNALPTLCFDRARKHSTALMNKPVEVRGLLDGRP